MIEGEAMQLIYLGIASLGAVVKNLMGWNFSEAKFNLRTFIKTTIPAIIIVGFLVWNIEPVWNLKAAFLLFAASMGIAKGQSLATRIIKKK